MLNLIITTLCLIAMITLATVVVIRLCRYTREEKLRFFKNYKKGGAIIIYIIALPLYYVGLRYDGLSIGGALLNSIANCIELIVLKIDYAGIASLMNHDVFYAITMSFCFILTFLNAVLFTLSLIGKYLYNRFKLWKITRLGQKVEVVIGVNEASYSIITSKATGANVILLVEDSDDVQDFAFLNKIAYAKIFNANVGETLIKLFGGFETRNINVIVNTLDDAKNLLYVEQLSNVLEVLNLKKYAIDEIRGLNIYVFGEPENSSAFLYFQEKSDGCIQYIDKHKLVAMDFVNRYPITEFMTEKEIDYATATLKENVDVNVVMLGFGKTNQQVFLSSVAVNQFVTYKGGQIVEKNINYHIYDKKDARNAKNLNHNYFRFTREVEKKKGNYLAIPEKPAEEKFYELDVNAFSFYESVKQNLEATSGRHAYNYIIIAFGSDMENLDFANKIVSKLKEWGLTDTTHVFVKIRSSALATNVVEEEFGASGIINTFGNEDEIVYDFSQIMNEKMENMAKKKHLIYATNDFSKALTEKEKYQIALERWVKLSEVQRASNIYAILSIRPKLHLLGYDYALETADIAGVGEEFMKVYTASDPITYQGNVQTSQGRRAISYTNDIKKNTVRFTYAYQEHARWNAYMISCGFVPLSKDEISKGISKDLERRKHANITTFDGLVEYRQMIAKALDKTEDEADVIRYDYQIMDDLVWMLNQSGRKIIKR